MQVIKSRRPLPEFRVIGLNRIVPELVEVAEYRKPPRYYVQPHAHEHWQLLYLIEGAARIGIAPEAAILLKPGSFVSIPANANHWAQYGTEPRHQLLAVQFDLDPVELRHPQWQLSESLHRFQCVHGVRYLENYFLQVIREATTPACYQELGLRLALDGLLLEIIRRIADPRPNSSIVSAHPAVSKALEMLETRFRERWAVSRLAKEVGLSQSRLTELFRQESGCSIQKFLNKTRVRRAENLLVHSDLRIDRVASECGFASIQHFSRAFKSVKGCSPMRFRRFGVSRWHQIEGSGDEVFGSSGAAA
jgi:AraC-like DNA-binding protein/quercetin dioxygenase-like cupin family protein